MKSQKISKKQWLIAIIAGLVFLALSTAFMNWISPANAVQHTGPNVSSNVSSISPKMPADPPSWSGAEAHKFRHNKLHHSTGRYVPKKVKQRMEKYAKSHDHLTPWWRSALNKGECMLNGDWIPGNISFCVKYGDNPTVSKINGAITRIKVVCGGTGAVIYMFSMNAVAGLGGGTAACVYDHWATFSLNFLGLQRAVPARSVE